MSFVPQQNSQNSFDECSFRFGGLYENYAVCALSFCLSYIHCTSLLGVCECVCVRVNMSIFSSICLSVFVCVCHFHLRVEIIKIKICVRRTHAECGECDNRSSNKSVRWTSCVLRTRLMISIIWRNVSICSHFIIVFLTLFLFPPALSLSLCIGWHVDLCLL